MKDQAGADSPRVDPDALEEALWQAAQSPPATIDAPLDIASGQALQLNLLMRWRAQGHTVGGWKIGMTSGEARDQLGPGVRPFGYVLAKRIVPSGATVAIADVAPGGVENELCFRFAATPPRGCPRGRIAEYLDGVAPAFELNQRRLSGSPSAGVRIADDLSNYGIVAGTFVPVPADLDALVVTLLHDNETLARVPSAGHIDNHFATLARLAAALPEHGLTIEPGHVVITGAYGRTPLAPGLFEGDFGPLGRVAVELV